MILDAFGLRQRRYVYLIGGGGKTTLMFAAAQALVAEGRSVLTSTTTRILHPEPSQSGCVVLGADAASLMEPLRVGLAAHRHVTVLAPDPDGGRKAGGIPVAVLDALVEARVAAHVLVEADGAAGRPLKAHADHEPVVSPRADLVIAIVGADCLGQPMDDAHVHRAVLLRERLGRPLGSRVTAQDVAAIVFHPDGYLARIAPGTPVIVFVNKAATPGALRDGRALAGTLRRMDAGGLLDRIVIGDVKSGRFEVPAEP